MRDAAGNTALHKAAECNQPIACRFLIANGADPLIKNCEGRVPADLATASVAKVIMEEPIKPNADIESQLLEAAKNGDLDTVKVRGERERRALGRLPHHTVWCVIFVESPKRPSKLIFVVLNFVTATSPGAWHCCTNDDVINTRARDLYY